MRDRSGRIGGFDGGDGLAHLRLHNALRSALRGGGGLRGGGRDSGRRDGGDRRV